MFPKTLISLRCSGYYLFKTVKILEFFLSLLLVSFEERTTVKPFKRTKPLQG